MRVPGTIFGTVALLFGFYQAPFAHIHVEEFDHPAGTSPVHWHLHREDPRSARPAISALTADDDAIDLGWNAVKCSFTHIPNDLGVATAMEVAAVSLAGEPVQLPLRGGHDPPDVTRKSPRAPPL